MKLQLIIIIAFSVLIVNARTLEFGGTIAYNDIDGLYEVKASVFSRDGRFFYTSSGVGDAAITWNHIDILNNEIIQDGILKYNQYGTMIFNGDHIIIRNDGQFIYSISLHLNSITWFKQDSATGELTYINYIREPTDTGLGIVNIYAIEISPDDKHVYVASPISKSMSWFECNEFTGELTYGGTIYNDSTGVDGIAEVRTIAVSPDGNSVYTSSPFTWLTRDSQTGELTWGGTILNNNGDPVAREIIYDPKITGDGIYIYAIADDSLVWYTRDITGEPRYAGSVKNGVNNIAGLTHVNRLTISPDDKFIYAGGIDTLSWYSIEPSTGQLSFEGYVVDNGNGGDGIRSITSISISNDGTGLLATARDDHAVTYFKRNVLDGSLEFAARIKDIDCLYYLRDIHASKDGKNVYVGGSYEGPVWFYRDSSNGNLTYGGALYQGENYTGVYADHGLNQVSAFVESPDEKFLYVTTAWTENDIAWLIRDSISGALNYIDHVDKFNQIPDVLDNPEASAITSDGKNLYVTNSYNDYLCNFTVNPVDGSLEYTEHFVGGVNGTVRYMRGVGDVLVSPDDRFVYVAAEHEHDIVLFSRDLTTGNLTHVSQEPGCFDVSGLAMSPDGAMIIAHPWDGTYMRQLERDSLTGDLTDIESIGASSDGIDALNGIVDAVFCPTGKALYTVSRDTGYVCWFDVTDSNTLVYGGYLGEIDHGINDLNGAWAVAVSPDGQNVYVASYDNNSVSWFHVDTATTPLNQKPDFFTNLKTSKIEVITQRSSLLVNFYSGKDEELQFKLFALDGTLVTKLKRWYPQKGFYHEQLNTGRTSAGFYVLTIESDGLMLFNEMILL